MDAQLCLEHLAEVQRLLKRIEHKWYDIGLQLGLDPARLQGIRLSAGTQGERLVSVIELWLKGLGPEPPTWEGLCRTLKGEVVEEPALASRIRQEKGENSMSM